MGDLHLRRKVSSYIRTYEHLISTMPGEAKLSDDECQMIDYYAAELSKATSPPSIENQLALKLF
jgi:hypothetical protein